MIDSHLMLETVRQRLKPSTPAPVREMLIASGFDVSDWAFDKNGQPLANPNTNSYRNSFWSFEDANGVIALCIWHDEIRAENGKLIFDANMRILAADYVNELGRPSTESGRKTALRTRIKKAGHFASSVFKANRERTPIRVIILGDNVAVSTEAEHPANRLLDPDPWYVERCDGMSGDFHLCRGSPPLYSKQSEDEAESDEISQAVNQIMTSSDLSDTEKEALVKQRVGQGLFRKRLLARWKSCAITRCANSELLIASHIIPWSKCSTADERLGPSNGLLLVAHLDKLFDLGYIAFDDSFEMIISPLLSFHDRSVFDIAPRKRIRGGTADLLPALRWHRTHRLKA